MTSKTKVTARQVTATSRKIYRSSIRRRMPLPPQGRRCASAFGQPVSGRLARSMTAHRTALRDSWGGNLSEALHAVNPSEREIGSVPNDTDRKSTRLNSSHVKISYAVFCLKKKKHQMI